MCLESREWISPLERVITFFKRIKILGWGRLSKWATFVCKWGLVTQYIRITYKTNTDIVLLQMYRSADKHTVSSSTLPSKNLVCRGWTATKLDLKWNPNQPTNHLRTTLRERGGGKRTYLQLFHCQGRETPIQWRPDQQAPERERERRWGRNGKRDGTRSRNGQWVCRERDEERKDVNLGLVPKDLKTRKKKVFGTPVTKCASRTGMEMELLLRWGKYHENTNVGSPTQDRKLGLGFRWVVHLCKTFAPPFFFFFFHPWSQTLQRLDFGRTRLATIFAWWFVFGQGNPKLQGSIQPAFSI